MGTTKKTKTSDEMEVKSISLVEYAEPHSEDFKEIDSKITKEKFEEKDFYPSEKKVTKGEAPKAPEAQVSTNTTALTGVTSEAKYIDLDKSTQASFLKFSDGSIYKVGEGFMDQPEK